MDVSLVLLLHVVVFVLIFISFLINDFYNTTDNGWFIITTALSFAFTVVFYGNVLFSMTPKIIDVARGFDFIIGVVSILITVLVFSVIQASFEQASSYGASLIVVKNKLSKNYTKEHSNMILKLIQELNISGIIEFNKYTLCEKSDKESYNGWSFNRRKEKEAIIDSILVFINTLVGYSDNKKRTEIVEETLLEKENANTLAFVLNVFGDSEKVKFIFSEDGLRQREMLKEDLSKLNKQVNSKVIKVNNLTKDTYKNKMNTELDSLRQNNFDKIEEMKK